jgi:hypothetical protein
VETGFGEKGDRAGGERAGCEFARNVREHERSADNAQDVRSLGKVEVFCLIAKVSKNRFRCQMALQ